MFLEKAIIKTRIWNFACSYLFQLSRGHIILVLQCCAQHSVLAWTTLSRDINYLVLRCFEKVVYHWQLSIVPTRVHSRLLGAVCSVQRLTYIVRGLKNFSIFRKILYVGHGSLILRQVIKTTRLYIVSKVLNNYMAWKPLMGGNASQEF